MAPLYCIWFAFEEREDALPSILSTKTAERLKEKGREKEMLFHAFRNLFEINSVKVRGKIALHASNFDGFFMSPIYTHTWKRRDVETHFICPLAALWITRERIRGAQTRIKAGVCFARVSLLANGPFCNHQECRFLLFATNASNDYLSRVSICFAFYVPPFYPRMCMCFSFQLFRVCAKWGTLDWITFATNSVKHTRGTWIISKPKERSYIIAVEIFENAQFSRAL